MRAFNRLVITGVIVILFLLIAGIYGMFMSVFYYGANIATGVEAIVSYDIGSRQYQNCVNQYGADNIACQYIYNQTIQAINNYQSASFWYGISGNPFIWITIVGIIGVIAYMLYVQNKG